MTSVLATAILAAAAGGAGVAVGCAQEAGQEMGTCDATVTRESDGIVQVRVAFPNGFSRVLSFERGEFLRGNPTMSGVGTDTEWHLSGGVYSIRVDDQGFVLPEGLVTGE